VLGGGVAEDLWSSRVLGGILGEFIAVFGRAPGFSGRASSGLPAGMGFRVWGFGLDARLAGANVCECGRLDNLDGVRSAEFAECECVGIGRG